MAMSTSCKKKEPASQEMCVFFPENLSPEGVCFDVFAEGGAEAAEGFSFSQSHAVKIS